MSHLIDILLAVMLLAVTTCEARLNGHYWNNFQDGNELTYQADQSEYYYLEVLVIADHKFYLWKNKNESQVHRYFKSFFKAVDKRFSLLNDPKVKINIVDVIVSQSPEDTPYLINNGKNGLICIEKAFDDVTKYLFGKKNLPQYDIAVIMTGEKFCHCDETCNKETAAGMANKGGACKVDEFNKAVNSVVMVHDNGGFANTIVTAHEIAHLLDAYDDEHTTCSPRYGHIMGYNQQNERRLQWSECSKNSIREFLKSEDAKCLRNKPEEDSFFGIPMPGELMSLQDQCKMRGGEYKLFCPSDSGVCSDFMCYYEHFDKYKCRSSEPAAEHSECGDNKHCSDGYCIPRVGRNYDHDLYNVDYTTDLVEYPSHPNEDKQPSESLMSHEVEVLSFDKQCKQKDKDSLYFYGQAVCRELICFNPQEKLHKHFGIPADGTICGDNMVCSAGKCVRK